MNSRSEHELRVVAPYRLDLTVSVLRRLSSNLVDRLTPAGEYLRVLVGAAGPLLVRVRQPSAESLRVTLDGPTAAHADALALVRQTLGTERDLTHFRRVAAGLPWLGSLEHRMRGVRPPRYPSLWEAFVNAVIFQQVSLQSASAITRRLIVALEQPVGQERASSYPFPDAPQLLGAPDRALHGVGLSASKLATLRRAGEVLESGALTLPMLEALPSEAAAAMLQRIKGIGPWTATLILLRGLGRLDVFPVRDTSVARNLVLVGGAAPPTVSEVIEALQPEQGMVYYYLLLARLESRGELGRPSDAIEAREAVASPRE